MGYATINLKARTFNKGVGWEARTFKYDILDRKNRGKRVPARRTGIKTVKKLLEMFKNEVLLIHQQGTTWLFVWGKDLVWENQDIASSWEI